MSRTHVAARAGRIIIDGITPFLLVLATLTP